MLRMGFLLPNIGGSQLAFRLIANANKAISAREKIDIAIFYENLSIPCYPPGFVTTNIADAWMYNGELISTTLSTAHKSLRFPGGANKFFYVWDLEWIYMDNKQFEEINNIYTNPQLKLISRSEYQAKAIENTWGVKIYGIVPEFNILKFKEILNGKK